MNILVHMIVRDGDLLYRDSMGLSSLIATIRSFLLRHGHSAVISTHPGVAIVHPYTSEPGSIHIRIRLRPPGALRVAVVASYVGASYDYGDGTCVSVALRDVYY